MRLAINIFLSSFLLLSASARAEVQGQSVEYSDGDVKLEGYLATDNSLEKARPTVVIIHQWMGLTSHEKESADKLAKLGYVAMAVDIYGKGVHPQSTDEAGALATKYKEDTELYRKRIKAALKYLSTLKSVDQKHIVVMGYCFGGTGALEAARAGFPVVGVASFHGGLATKNSEKTKAVKPKLLVMHGALDPYVKREEVVNFTKEMNAAKADYQMIIYSGAVHAFTQKEAGTDISKGAAYNENAARRSWQALLQFLGEVAPL